MTGWSHRPNLTLGCNVSLATGERWYKVASAEGAR